MATRASRRLCMGLASRCRVPAAAVTVLALGLLPACGSPSEPDATSAPSRASQTAGPEPDEVIPAGTCESDVCSTAELARWSAVPFTPPVPCDDRGTTCRLTMDVLAPSSPGSRPIVVLVSGGPNPLTNQVYVQEAAFPVAVRGAVVVHAVWRQDRDQGGGWPTSFQDIACAVGVARAIGPDYGGDPDRVVLVGHSLGGWASAVVAMSPVEVVPAETGCNETSGSLRPDALVTLAGAVDLDEDGPGHQQFLRGFFDGSRQDRPGRWREADPFALATLAEHPDVAITVVHGTGDVTVAPEVSRRFVAALGKNGYRSDLVEVPDADHLAILAAPATTDAIVAALDPG